MIFNNKFKIKQIVLPLILFILFLTFYVSISQNFLNAQDEGVIYHSSKNFISQHNFRCPCDQLNIEYKTNVFYDYYCAYKTPTEVYFKQFPSTIIFYSTFVYLFGEKVLFYLSPLFGSLTVVIIFFLSKSIFKSYTASIFSSIILGTSPIFANWSSELFSNIPASFFLFASFLLIINYKSRKNIFFLLIGICLICMLIVRLDYIIFIPGIIIFIHYHIKEINIKKKILLIFTLLLFVFPVINIIAYKDPLYSTYLSPRYMENNSSKGLEDSFDSLNHILLWLSGTKDSIKEFDLSEKITNVGLHIIGFFKSYWVFPGVYPGLVGLFLLQYKKNENKKFLLLFVAFFVIVILFYGNRFTYYGDFENTRSSFFRYLLPLYIYLSIFIGYMFSILLEQTKNKKMKIILIAIISILALCINVDNITSETYKGITTRNSYRLHDMDRMNEITSLISQNTETNEVKIVLNGYVTFKYLNSDILNYSTIYHHRFYTDVQRDVVIPLIMDISKSDYKIFLVSRDEYEDKEIITLLKSTPEIKLNLIKKIDNLVYIYRITSGEKQ